MTLEELLNKLIKKGWKPRGYNDIKKITVENNKNVKQKVIHLRPEIGVDAETLTRFICVKESGLWQYVCENGMLKTGREFISWTKNANCDDYGNLFWDKSCPKDFYEYRLIESALCDEDKLEQILLDNIKI